MMKGLLGPQEAQSEIHNGKNFGKKKKESGSLSPSPPVCPHWDRLSKCLGPHINGYEVLSSQETLDSFCSHDKPFYSRATSAQRG